MKLIISFFKTLISYVLTIIFILIYWVFYWGIISWISLSLFGFPTVPNGISYTVFWAIGILYWKHNKIIYKPTDLPLWLAITPATGSLTGGIFIGITIGLLNLLIYYVFYVLLIGMDVTDIYNIQTPISFIIYTIVSVCIFGGIGGAILEIISKGFN